MTVKFRSFQSKPVTIEALLVTEETVEQIATYMGADSYSIETVLVGGEQKVNFYTYPIHNGVKQTDHPHTRLRSRVGDWIVKIPQRVNDRLYEDDVRFHSVTQADIDHFIGQANEEGGIDPDTRADKE